MADVPWRIEGGALKIAVRLTPRGGRDGLDGVEVRDDGRPVLKARVRAAPEDGAANAALERLLAGRRVLPVGPRPRTQTLLLTDLVPQKPADLEHILAS